MSADIEDYIREKVSRGEFQTREDFVEATVALYRDLEDHDSLCVEIQGRVEDAAAGRVGPLDIASIKARLRSEFPGTD